MQFKNGLCAIVTISLALILILAVSPVNATNAKLSADDIKRLAKPVDISNDVMILPSLSSPMACDWIDYTCNLSFFWNIPNVNSIPTYSMRFSPPGPDPCTLTTISLALYADGSANVSGAGIQVVIWEDDGFGLPGAPLDFINVPGPAIQYYPDLITVAPSFPIELPGDFHVGYQVIDPVLDTFSLLSDDATCGTNRSTALFDGSWYLLDDLFGPGNNYNFFIFAEVCCGGGTAGAPLVTNHPDTLNENMCSSIYYDFFAESSGESPVFFEMIGGPGTMDPATGEWNFDPSSAELGSYQLLYQVCDDFGCSDIYVTEIEIVNDPPVIVRPCDSIINGTEGDHIIHFIDAIGPERCDDITYYLAAGPGTIDPATGVYSWETGPTSPGVHSITIGASDFAGETTLCNFTIDITPDDGVCGDANGDGIVNVGDAVFLINFVFKGGQPPDPITLGDANDDGLTNVGDAVYIISYVFKGGPEPCAVGGEEPCCSAPACAPNVAVGVDYKKVASTKVNCGGNFGLWQGYSVTATYGACCKNGDTWQMRVKGCESTYSISACAQGRTDVNAAGDVANLADCKKVVADLEFKGAPAPGRAAKKDYTSTDCTNTHEEKHQEEWETAFDAEWVTTEPLIEALETACVVPAVDTPAEAVAVMKPAADALVKAADAAAWANTPGHGPPDTSGAYAAQKACHDALIAALKAAFAGC